MGIVIDPVVDARVREIVSEINRIVFEEKRWELFKKDAQDLVNKYSVNELLMCGVKYIKHPNQFYLELPYKGIDDSMLNKILADIYKSK